MVVLYITRGVGVGKDLVVEEYIQLRFHLSLLISKLSCYHVRIAIKVYFGWKNPVFVEYNTAETIFGGKTIRPITNSVNLIDTAGTFFFLFNSQKTNWLDDDERGTCVEEAGIHIVIEWPRGKRRRLDEYLATQRRRSHIGEFISGRNVFGLVRSEEWYKENVFTRHK